MQLAKRSKDGRVLVEGVHLLKEALASGVSIESVLFVPRKASEEAEEVVGKAVERGIEIVEMSDDCFRKFSQLKSSENVAMIFTLSQMPADNYVEGQKKIVILDNIQDPGNAGAIVRIAEAAGMDGCIFIGGASVNNGKFLRATMGAVFRIPCTSLSYEEFSQLIDGKEFRLIVTALDRSASPFSSISYSVEKGGIGICFGSEGSGVSDEMSMLAKEKIYIPMAGKVESLNVAVAAGIVLYHAGFGVK